MGEWEDERMGRKWEYERMGECGVAALERKIEIWNAKVFLNHQELTCKFLPISSHSPMYL
jgi:hypothetical protein